MGETGRSTDNNSGQRDSELVLPQTRVNRERAEKVDAMIKASRLGRQALIDVGCNPQEVSDIAGVLTRRQARKILQKREGRR